MKVADITPVEIHNGIYYKRDDYFTPYGPHHVNGGKTRQAISLFQEIKEDVKNIHNGGVVTSSSVGSPQSAIIAKVAAEFGFKCIIGVGGTKPELLYNHHMMKLSRYYGADIQIVAGHGMTVAIDSAVKKKIISENNYKLIKFAISLETNPEAIFDGVADQVKNIPDELDNLVISVGSGIQFAGIIRGLERYNKKVKRVIGVAFLNRRKTIDEYLNKFKYNIFEGSTKQFHDYEIALTPYAYSKPIWEDVGGEMIDDIYEGKAHHWMRENIDTEKEKTLFWIIGRRLTEVEVDRLL